MVVMPGGLRVSVPTRADLVEQPLLRGLHRAPRVNHPYNRCTPATVLRALSHNCYVTGYLSCNG